MDDEQQTTLLGCSNGCESGLVLYASLVFSCGGVEEDIASRLKPDAVLYEISGCFFRVPDELLSTVKEENVHTRCIYFACNLVKLDEEVGCGSR